MSGQLTFYDECCAHHSFIYGTNLNTSGSSYKKLEHFFLIGLLRCRVILHWSIKVTSTRIIQAQQRAGMRMAGSLETSSFITQVVHGTCSHAGKRSKYLHAF